MKKLPILIAVAAFFAISCAMQSSGGTGSLSLPSSQIRAALGESATGSSLIRYSLTRNGQSVPINNQAVVEGSLTSQIKIDSLSPGSGYKLAISVGYRSENVFIVDYYGNTGNFSISEGSDTEVGITLARAPVFKYLTKTGALASATVLKGVLYIMDGNRLLTFDKSYNVIETVTLGSDYKVNSISLGKCFVSDPATGKPVIADELWLNTNKGIYHKSGSVYISNMDAGLEPNVSISGAIDITDPSGTVGPQIFGLYSGGMKTLGMVIASKQEEFTSKWYTLEKGIKEYKEIDDFVSAITTDIVGSISINQSYNVYYVSTPLGTLIGSLNLKKISDDVDTFKKAPISSLKDFWLKIGDGSKSIKLVSTAGNRVYASANKGLYTSDVQTSGTKIGVPVSGLSLIGGTEDRSFNSLASFATSATTVVTAAVTSDNSVMIIKDAGVSETLDAATGIPRGAQATFYLDNAGAVHVVLTGSNGVVDYLVK